ncbi:MAG: signal peptidase II [Bacteroidetes bacterium]|nr:MAG: signal peptidase II [Bacteroidota bacterium]
MHTAMKPSFKLLFFLFVIFSAVGCDRITKNLAKKHLVNRERISYLDELVHLQYAENTGAAMSLGADWSEDTRFWLFVVIPILTLILMLGYAIWHASELQWFQLFAFGLVFAGGMGNLTDRVLYDSRVPDFMILGTDTLRTGIFNVADVWITTGAVLLIGIQLFGKKQD